MYQRAYDKSEVILVEDSDVPAHSGQGYSLAYQARRQRLFDQAVILSVIVVKDDVNLS
tara:strand:- start:16600 stop:16773 length:174 start_codon:yes stop_codon:yes gene_type:complete